jgi:hypothetical protein
MLLSPLLADRTMKVGARYAQSRLSETARLLADDRQTRTILRFGGKRRYGKEKIIVYSLADTVATMGLPGSRNSWRAAEMNLTSYS